MGKKSPKKLRKENRYQSQEVAKKLHMLPSTYSRKENGHSKWTFSDAQKLSKLYGVRIDNLKL